jgi:hypothetical protein
MESGAAALILLTASPMISMLRQPRPEPADSFEGRRSPRGAEDMAVRKIVGKRLTFAPETRAIQRFLLFPRKVTTWPRSAATNRRKLRSSAGWVRCVRGEFVAITRQAAL